MILELIKEIRRFDPNMSREQNQRYYELEKYITQIENRSKQKRDVYETLDGSEKKAYIEDLNRLLKR